VTMGDVYQDSVVSGEGIFDRVVSLETYGTPSSWTDIGSGNLNDTGEMGSTVVADTISGVTITPRFRYIQYSANTYRVFVEGKVKMSNSGVMNYGSQVHVLTLPTFLPVPKDQMEVAETDGYTNENHGHVAQYFVHHTSHSTKPQEVRTYRLFAATNTSYDSGHWHTVDDGDVRNMYFKFDYWSG